MVYRLFGEDVSASKAMKNVGEGCRGRQEEGRGAAEKGQPARGHRRARRRRRDPDHGPQDSVDGLSVLLEGSGRGRHRRHIQAGPTSPPASRTSSSRRWATCVRRCSRPPPRQPGRRRRSTPLAAAKVMAAGQWLLNAALAANPIGLVILAIVALIGIFVLAYNKVGWFRAAVDAAWSGIKIADLGRRELVHEHGVADPAARDRLHRRLHRLMWTVFSSVVGWIMDRAALAGSGRPARQGVRRGVGAVGRHQGRLPQRAELDHPSLERLPHPVPVVRLRLERPAVRRRGHRRRLDGRHPEPADAGRRRHHPPPTRRDPRQHRRGPVRRGCRAARWPLARRHDRERLHDAGQRARDRPARSSRRSRRTRASRCGSMARPTGEKVEIEFTPGVWTDVSADVRGSRVSVKYGRVGVLRPRRGRAQPRARRPGGNYTVRNAASPYYPNVVPASASAGRSSPARSCCSPATSGAGRPASTGATDTCRSPPWTACRSSGIELLSSRCSRGQRPDPALGARTSVTPPAPRTPRSPRTTGFLSRTSLSIHYQGTAGGTLTFGSSIDEAPWADTWAAFAGHPPGRSPTGAPASESPTTRWARPAGMSSSRSRSPSKLDRRPRSPITSCSPGRPAGFAAYVIGGVLTVSNGGLPINVACSSDVVHTSS